MTREEFNKEFKATNKCEERIGWLEYCSEERKKQGIALNLITFVSLGEALGMVREVYNDFESRTCESCKYFRVGFRTDYCNKIGIDLYVPKTQSCSKWERLDKWK